MILNLHVLTSKEHNPVFTLSKVNFNSETFSYF
uniref:Uncharacterized protein n=1 Tax=Myoviridae sp. ctpKu3 TaxID=2825175 RepID=A0A8S5UW63_9CAUD|nr:MAG TPA: hypothetical protein [Myoviridae sp. ctpKu3]